MFSSYWLCLYNCYWFKTGQQRNGAVGLRDSLRSRYC